MSARKPFKPIDETLLDDVADRVATANNIPTLRPPSPETVAPAPTRTSTESTIPAAPPPDRKQGTSAAPRQGVDYFRVRCPDYVTDQLENRRAELRRQGKHVTISYLVMKALRTDGYHIAEDDFVEDGRRLR